MKSLKKEKKGYEEWITFFDSKDRMKWRRLMLSNSIYITVLEIKVTDYK
jgi:hypothetical protein